MNKSHGTQFDKFKRFLAVVSGIAVLGCSIYLTRKGVGLSDELWWMSLIVAIALCCSEFMFNGKFSELTWTGIILGLGAYIYSINTNINGLYFYRHIEGTLFTNFDWTSFSGGVFMDVYPELAIAWGLKESKVGDFLGNLVKTISDPEQLTTEEAKPKEFPNSIPKRDTVSKPEYPPYLQNRISIPKDPKIIRKHGDS